MTDVDTLILNSIKDDWKTIPTISVELNQHRNYITKRISQLEKYDLVLCSFEEKQIHKKGKIARIFKKKGD